MPSASDPLRSATAKNPNTLSATMYSAVVREGSTSDAAASHESWSRPDAAKYCHNTSPL